MGQVFDLASLRLVFARMARDTDELKGSRTPGIVFGLEAAKGVAGDCGHNATYGNMILVARVIFTCLAVRMWSRLDVLSWGIQIYKLRSGYEQEQGKRGTRRLSLSGGPGRGDRTDPAKPGPTGVGQPGSNLVGVDQFVVMKHLTNSLQTYSYVKFVAFFDINSTMTSTSDVEEVPDTNKMYSSFNLKSPTCHSRHIDAAFSAAELLVHLPNISETYEDFSQVNFGADVDVACTYARLWEEMHAAMAILVWDKRFVTDCEVVNLATWN
ncbi:hypothetical protein Sjap_011151 [Stephania japonica]|uniref:Uncharacterized protein n=1 Tax=Stephania japonica TaxID=461633 RepID=A0AAP0JAU8_9MAGN